MVDCSDWFWVGVYVVSNDEMFVKCCVYWGAVRFGVHCWKTGKPHSNCSKGGKGAPMLL